MKTLHQTVQVNFTYPICFTTGLFTLGNPLLKDVICTQNTAFPRKVLCVVERELLQHHPELLSSIEQYCHHHGEFLTLVSPPLLFGGGERAKNEPDNVAHIHQAIHAYGICRHSYVIAIGGGALLDMVGYAATTAHRGVRLIRVPTTVLSQNDSAVGVKNGINAYGKKNFLGTFAPPAAVLTDFDFLTTLSPRDWRSGIAEAVKVALLKDGEYFRFIEGNAEALVRRDMAAMRRLIYRCAQLHLDHIATSGDPFELGSSRPLDFGHWAAHKLEALSDYALRHGEAVAIGVALDSTYAYLKGLLPERDWQRILSLLAALGFAVYTDELSLHLHDRANVRCILQGLNEFREHLGGQLTIMLLRRIGQGIEVHEVDHETVVEAIALLESFQAHWGDGGHNGQTGWDVSAHATTVDR